MPEAADGAFWHCLVVMYLCVVLIVPMDTPLTLEDASLHLQIPGATAAFAISKHRLLAHGWLAFLATRLMSTT